MAIPIFNLDLHLQKKREELLKSDNNHNKSPPKRENSYQQKKHSDGFAKIKHRYFTFFHPQKKFNNDTEQKNPQEQQLNDLIASSQKVMLQIDTVWPFDLFPDTLIIDPLKLTYTHRSFFMVEYTESILIEDLIEADVEEAPIFAALRLCFVSYPTRQIVIKPLWKSQAARARELIAGLRVAHRKHLHIENLPTEKFNKLGILQTSPKT